MKKDHHQCYLTMAHYSLRAEAGRLLQEWWLSVGLRDPDMCWRYSGWLDN
jgi:hypothetical protein